MAQMKPNVQRGARHAEFLHPANLVTVEWTDRHGTNTVKGFVLNTEPYGVAPIAVLIGSYADQVAARFTGDERMAGEYVRLDAIRSVTVNLAWYA